MRITGQYYAITGLISLVLAGLPAYANFFLVGTTDDAATIRGVNVTSTTNDAGGIDHVFELIDGGLDGLNLLSHVENAERVVFVDRVIGFGDATVETDRIQVSALTTDPLMRRRGVGSALLRALRQDHEALAVATDVLLGHFEAEQFLEANGFVPGEIRQGSMFGIEVIERRWWNDAVAESRQARGAGGDR